MTKFAVFVLALALAACDGNMAEQPRYRTFDASARFPGGTSALPLPSGAVPRGAIVDDDALRLGRVDGEFVADIPVQISRDVLAQGRKDYEIYCAPCHGLSGDGDGIMTAYHYPRPPSLHTDSLRDAPDGYLFDVISRGKGIMFPYDTALAVPARWSIVAYVRALQLSQHAPQNLLAPADQERLP